MGKPQISAKSRLRHKLLDLLKDGSFSTLPPTKKKKSQVSPPTSLEKEKKEKEENASKK